MAVDGDPALGDVVEPGDQVAQGALAPAGGAHHGDGLPGLHLEVHVAEHLRLVPLVGEAHILHGDVPPDVGEVDGVGLVLEVRLDAHQLDKPVEAGEAVGEELVEVGHLPHGVDEGADIEVEGDEVHIAHLAPHDVHPAHGDHRQGQDAHKELHGGVKPAHGLVKVALGGLELLVGAVELAGLGVLVGEGLGGAHAGEAGLNVGVDGGHGLLHAPGGVHHGLPVYGGDQNEDGDQNQHHQGQLPADGEHHHNGPRHGDQGDKQVLRPVVGQLRDVEELPGHPAHEMAGAVLVVEPEGEGLDVGEEVPADIRLHPDAEGVAPVADHVLQERPEEVGGQKGAHNQKEGGIQPRRQQPLHTYAGHVGKGQVDHGDQEGAAQVHEEELPVGPKVGEEDAQGALCLVVAGCHGVGSPRSHAILSNESV